MAGWHHWLDGRESEWTPGVGDGQGGLACCDSWGRKELDMTERLYWTEGAKSKSKNISDQYHIIFNFCVCSVIKPCLTVCDSMDCSLPVYGIFHSRILDGMGCHFLLQEIFLTQVLNLRTCVSCIGRQIILVLNHH